MKTKKSFVTNSSSTSFIIIGNEITKDQAITCNFEDVVVVAQENFFEFENLTTLDVVNKELMNFFDIRDENELDQLDIRFFKSYFHQVQYSDCGLIITEIPIDIPKGTKIYTYPCSA